MIKKFQNYTEDELRDAGVTFGSNVHIANDVILHNPQNIIIGNNVRIDTQCMLIAGKNTKIILGNYIHISAGTYMFGNSGNIILEDYSGTSSRCVLYTSNDDYTEGYMTNPMVPENLRKVKTGDIILKKHVIVGCFTVILPNVTLEHGTSVGAHSLVSKSTQPFDLIFGIPAKFIKKRKNVHLT
jgi:galactoside O-acetyltransferase